MTLVSRGGRGPRARWAVLAALAALSFAARADEGSGTAALLAPAVREASAMPRLQSLLVADKGELVVERYFNGAAANKVANIKSVSKSVISALVGIAIERGHIPVLDTPIARYFEQLQADPSPVKRSITIEHLLVMQAGLEPTSNRNYGAWVASRNWVEYALARPLVANPGSQLLYSTGNTHLLSAILTRATGQSTLEFARAALGEPLGFRLAPWPRDPQGIYFGGNDMEMTPRQMLAFGLLYLNGGVAPSGRRLISAEWIEASFTPRAESPREAGRYYGLGWWIRTMAGHETPYAWGYGGQFIVLVPDLGVVIVTTSDSTPGSDRRAHTRRLHDFFEHSIVGPLSRATAQPKVARIR